MCEKPVKVVVVDVGKLQSDLVAEKERVKVLEKALKPLVEKYTLLTNTEVRIEVLLAEVKAAKAALADGSEG